MEISWPMRRVAWVAPLAAVLAVLAAAPQGYLGKEHDDALYVLAAQSLAEGRYAHWYLPGRPVITETTPGLPALLFPVARWAAEHWSLYQAVSALFLALSAWMVWAWARRRFPWEVAAGITLIFGLNPLVLSRSGIVMPEAPFLLAVLAVLLVFDVTQETSLVRSSAVRSYGLWPFRRHGIPSSNSTEGKSEAGRANPLPWDAATRGAALGTGLAAAYLIRPAALPLWLAVWAALALRRRWRELPWAAGIPLLTAAAWALWCRQGAGVQEAVELRTLYAAARPGDALAALGLNLWRLLQTTGQTMLPLAWTRSWAAPAMGLALWTLAGTGLWRGRRSPEPGGLFLLFSVGMHALWPWWFDRYLLPLLPFLWAAALGAFPRVRSRPLAAGLALASLIVFGTQSLGFYKSRSGSPSAAPAYAWAKRHTAPGDRFASALYARDLLHTGRLFQPLPNAASPPAFIQELRRRRIRFVLWERSLDLGFTRGENRITADLGRMEAALADPSSFTKVYEAGTTAVYEVLPVP